MKKTAFAAVAAMTAAGAAQAGGIDRSGQSIDVLFQDGNYAEISFGSVAPNVSGTVATPAGVLGSNNMSNTYWTFGAAMKHQINENLSYAIILDQPFGADVTYDPALYPVTGSQAEFKSTALTGILRYRMDNGFGMHGGLRVQRVSATAGIPVVGGYSVNGQDDTGTGYLAGFSYERPDIALRVALTYHSAIKTKHRTTEAATLPVAPGVFVPVTRYTTTEIETPQSVNLSFQTGVAKDTLVFGGVRWVDWSDFSIDPSLYRQATGNAFLSYQDDTTTYSLGLGRRLSETWSASLSMSYEDGDSNTPISNLGPTSGKFGVTLGARYKNDNISISTGVNYTWLGNATTQVPIAPSPPPVLASTQFKDNSAVGFGVKVGWHY